jgi:hypothetical protein
MTRAKAALLVGINYFDSPNTLYGCVNDIKNVRHCLLKHYSGWEKSNITLLRDDRKDAMPSKKRILREFKQLMKNENATDILFHYSGHGGQQFDENGDEQDGMDEVIFPCDMNEVITDDEINKLIRKHLRPEQCLTMIFDCCHAGSIADLPYLYECHYSLACPSTQWKVIDGRVLSISGCRDDQTSAEICSQGALTWAFLKTLKLFKYDNEKTTIRNVMVEVYELLKDSYTQKPQVSSNQCLDLLSDCFMF